MFDQDKTHESFDGWPYKINTVVAAIISLNSDNIKYSEQVSQDDFVTIFCWSASFPWRRFLRWLVGHHIMLNTSYQVITVSNQMGDHCLCSIVRISHYNDWMICKV